MAVYFAECLKCSVILNFEPLRMEKLLLGGKSKAQDDQFTCRAENSMPQSSKYNRDIYFGFRDVLIL